jgi:hypothetical protein
MATGKVVSLALVSIYNQGEAGVASAKSGIDLLHDRLKAWQRYGTTRVPLVAESCLGRALDSTEVESPSKENFLPRQTV